MKRTVLHILLAAAIVAAVAAVPGEAAAYKVVVNAGNPVVALSSAQLERFFLKKATRWEDGAEVQPVDLADDSAVRASFSREILGKDVSAIKSYWQKMIFSGRATPPPELSSDAQVIEYVRTNRGAIGYVSAGASVGDGVTVVKVSD